MMRKILASLILFILVIPPAGSFAADLHSASKTYLRFRETASGDLLIPLYEYLDFNAENIGEREISFFAGFWGRVDLADESYTGRAEGDLQYAYLSYRGGPYENTINLGRFFTHGGVSSEQVDGLSAKMGLKGGFEVSAYGGLPVEADFDGRGGDYILGGRVAYENPGEEGPIVRIGLSALKEDNDSRDFREEEGFDIWVRPVEIVEFQGHSFYNSITSGWSEHAYYLTVTPVAKLRLTGEAVGVDYRDYFQSPTLSVFTPIFQDPDESLFLLGLGAHYGFTSAISAGLEYKSFDYDIMEGADYYGGYLNYTGPGAATGGLSLHRLDGGTDDLSYYQFRIYARKDFGKIDVTLDFFDVNYDEAKNGVTNAYSISAAGGYDFNEKARLVGDFEFQHNPFFDEDLRVFIKFLYQFGTIPWGA